MSLRVAVHPGPTTRVAVADPGPRLVAELPGHVEPGDAVALLFGTPVTPVVVGPGGVPVAVAVGGAPRRIVVDGDASRTEVSLVDGARVRTTQVAAPQVAAAVVVLARDHAVDEIVLVGGPGRDPALAALLDAADVAPVRVPAAPEAAAVLGAAAAAQAADVPRSDVDVVAALLTVPRRRRASALVAAGLALASVGVGGAVLGASATVPPRPVAAGGDLVQYGYRFALPDGWTHSGGLPERRRTVVTPAGAPDGVELVAVERTDLGYDAGLEPARAAADLRALYDGAVAAGEHLTGFAPARAAGRDVHTYRQSLAGGGTVDWTVVLDGTAQLSVGCRHGAAPSPALRAACAGVVASLTRS